ncbi:transglutaminase domain-containing protein [candidate division KSB1 bacterium]|nr:transglutaminase domain-containing protein [candidate division KSB1 bacterium]
MKKIIMICVMLLTFSPAQAENYLLNGGQESKIDYRMSQKVTPNPAIRKLYLTFVKPSNYQSPTYNQRVENLKFSFIPSPDEKSEYVDDRGNQVIKVTWHEPARSIQTDITFSAYTKTLLQKLNTTTPFPITDIPETERYYLGSTEQVPTGDPAIVAKANELTKGAKTEFDAVQRILTWVIDHMNYVLTPESYNGLYSFKSGKGNCQNYSHLSAAMMRAVGIPVRIVNGITLKRPYTIDIGRGKYTLKMAEGRHSWVEVFFPDLGWVPFDPQQTALFVSNRFIRVEIGTDNNETSQDGLIRWSQTKGTLATPEFEEIIESNFSDDQVTLTGIKQTYGPKKMLLIPEVTAAFIQKPVIKKPEPVQIEPDQLEKMQYTKPFMYGNLEFPKGVDFLSTRGPAEQENESTYEIKKNFLVETAEYVTSGEQYAQVFVLQKPLKLGIISLALHNFGGSGELWVELFDEKNGMPNEVIASSDFISLEKIPFKPGYVWIDFDFKRDWPKLSPGKYWISLGFTGRPIVNWFYTYGKPVGPIDGTRYKTILDTEWSNSLSFEFNYRVVGFTID